MGRLQNKSNIRRAGETAAFQTYTEDSNMAEYLDVIDDNGNLTGETVAREVAHRDGIRHRTSHLWLLRKKDGANLGTLLNIFQHLGLQLTVSPIKPTI